MIAKIPIYIEVPGKMSPQDFAQLTTWVQAQLTDELIKLLDGEFSWKIGGIRKTFKIITEKEMRAKVVKTVSLPAVSENL